MTRSDSPKASPTFSLVGEFVNILVLINLYPPHHAGTFEWRCQAITEALRLRGHTVLILTSNHGLNTEQRDQEIHRRLLLNGAYGHAPVTGFRAMQNLEEHNHRV